MKIASINHVQITIPIGEEAQAKAFYCDILGMQEIDKPLHLRNNGGFWLSLGAMQFHIGCEDNPQRANTKAHIAFNVDNAAVWRKHLSEHGITLIENLPISGFERFDVRDPFGNRLEFMQAL